MRLSEWVRLHGVDPFTFEDFLYVGSKVATDPERLILVGGQAIETWGVVFKVPAPTGDHHPLTEDTDWLGDKNDAKWLCDQLGPDVHLEFAGSFEPGPSTALAYIKRDGRVLMMDFLRAIVGPENSEVRRLAVAIEVAGVTLHVLHPLLCLESRLANIAVLPAKRKGNGPLQAEWAIGIASAFLMKTVEEGKEEVNRTAIRVCHRIAQLAESRHAHYCYVHFGINPMRAVTAEAVKRIGGRFQNEDWPRTTARVANRQARWLKAFKRRGG